MLARLSGENRERRPHKAAKMKNKSKIKGEKRARRRARIRAKIFGTSKRPRLSIFKSNTRVYAQLVDDDAGKTLAAVSTSGEKGALAEAKEVGKQIAQKAKAKKIVTIVFDRGGYVYTGKIKAVAEGAREGGLKF